MNVINKTIAENVAEQLLAKTNVKIEKKENELMEKVEEIYISTIPKDEWVKVNELPKEWLKSGKWIEFKSPAQYFSHKASKYLPFRGDYVLISEKQITVLVKMNEEIDKIKGKRNTLKTQVVAQLLKLRTYNKIEKEFPEAFIFLPANTSTNLPAIQIKDLLNQINEL